jgi:hypothetical protein
MFFYYKVLDSATDFRWLTLTDGYPATILASDFEADGKTLTFMFMSDRYLMYSREIELSAAIRISRSSNPGNCHSLTDGRILIGCGQNQILRSGV